VSSQRGGLISAKDGRLKVLQRVRAKAEKAARAAARAVKKRAAEDAKRAAEAAAGPILDRVDKDYRINYYTTNIVGRGGYLGSLLKLSDVHVIGHVTARGPRVDIFSGHRAPYILPHRVSYVSFPQPT